MPPVSELQSRLCWADVCLVPGVICEALPPPIAWLGYGKASPLSGATRWLIDEVDDAREKRRVMRIENRLTFNASAQDFNQTRV